VTARKGHQPEEVVAKRRQVDVLVWQGQGVADAVRSTGVSEVTCYYRWRQEFGGLKVREAQVAIESWGGGTTTMSVRTPRPAAGRRRPPRW